MTLTPGAIGIRRDGQRTGTLQPSPMWEGCFCDQHHVWRADGVLAGAAPGGVLDIVGVVVA